MEKIYIRIYLVTRGNLNDNHRISGTSHYGGHWKDRRIYLPDTTGEAPTTEELSSALTRYFVMKEITDFVKMSREGESDT